MSCDPETSPIDNIFMAAQLLVTVAPVPGLGAAVIVVQEVYRLVKSVSFRESECRNLASYVGHVTWTIQTQWEEGKADNEILARAVFKLNSISQAVRDDLDRWVKWNRGMKLVKNNEIGEAIKSHKEALDTCMRELTTAQAVAQIAWNSRFEAAQQVDSQMIAEILRKQDELNENVKEMQMMMRSWVPYSAGDPDGRNLTRAKDELFQLRHERRDTYVLPLRTLDGEVQKIGTRPAHAGSMYDIWKGIWLGEYTVALKVFRGVNPRDKDKERIERQVDLWRALKHKNILRLYGICKLDYMATPPLYFVSPWMKNKDAITYCKTNPNVDRLRIIYDIAKGLEYIHGMGILHGGLQASNVLISLNGSAVLSDFSLSKVMDSGAMFTQSNGPSASLRWMSPEAHNAEVLTAQSDVYSWGMTALQILSLQIPFYKIKAMGQLVVSIAVKKIKPLREDYPGEDITDEMWELWEHTWKFEPEERPRVSQIVEIVALARKAKYNWNGLDGDEEDDAMDSEYPQSF